MGARYKATCKSCHYQFELTKGGGWTWYQKVCNDCGSCIKVPRNGPSWFPEGEMSVEDMAKHLATPEGWSRNGGRFDATEREMLDKMTSVCACGGQMIPEWDDSVQHRCPKCRSSDFDLNGEVLFD